MSMLRHLCILTFVTSFVASSLMFDVPRVHAAEEAAPAPDKVELLFVQTAGGATVDAEKGTLTLSDISPATIFFSDRPYRLAGHYSTEEFLALWTEGKDSFLSDPPNATLSVFEPGQDDPSELVVELKSVQLSGTDLVYDIRVLQGTVPTSSGGAALFIDVIGMPLTPMSYAGAARRWTRRALFY